MKRSRGPSVWLATAVAAALSLGLLAGCAEESSDTSGDVAEAAGADLEGLEVVVHQQPG